MDAVLEHGANADQEDAMPQQALDHLGLRTAHVSWRDQVTTKQICQDGGVNLVGFDLGFGNGLELARVSQGHAIGEFFQPIVHNGPVSSGLQHSRAVFPPVGVEELGHCLGVIGKFTMLEYLPILCHNDPIALVFAKVDTDVSFHSVLPVKWVFRNLDGDSDQRNLIVSPTGMHYVFMLTSW